ncbi:hypothetical protein RR48_03865 [Papilio machaon]|uniref:CHK kinase-like domain-containing protein n=1 Tax=Papilio machaon TaxID=76193 RepID=A0A0N1I9B8_PAPMA|nr:hypothetical protein RR48_03865 [Papilio machaon]
MVYNFKGEIEGINKSQFEFISEVLKKQKCHEVEVSVANVGKIGDNYGSHIKRFKAVLKDGEEFQMIAKIAPKTMILRDDKNINDIFMNEIVIFNELLPKFRGLQKRFNIPEEDIYKYPFCYGTLETAGNEMILLEDLNVSSYTMLDKVKPFKKEYVKTVLKNLANFHCLSYALKNKEPQMFNKFIGRLVNATLNSKSINETEKLFEKTLNDLLKIFDDNKYKYIINDVMQNLIKSWIQFIMSDSSSKYCVIHHGDLWTNNIMFQIQNNHPLGCILIDYQLSRDSLPVSDIHYFIFSCTDYETRSKHYHEWIDYYYSELDKYLNYFDLKADRIYPRYNFNADLKLYGKYGLGIAFVMMNFLLGQKHEANTTEVICTNGVPDNVKKGKFLNENLKTIKDRIEGLIKTSLEYDYISYNLEANN